MSYNSHKNIFAFLIFAAFLLRSISADCNPFAQPFYVHVIDNINSKDPLLLHCASGDDELGNHTLYNNGVFNFKFCETFFHRTLFFCRFRWTWKSIAVDVYKSKSRFDCSSFHCFWSARTDGIYFSGLNPPKNWTKRYSW
ncbi:hypothetical protein CDL12_11926 [Handroanthus impetiginosus]|uniref:S-protein homolog n=1 Tax=Handroanthus impetiginosus TaxID=429701 RepID=A0A2G9GZJ1_9LAMI|nr:hypothetical protein CDL12_16995 [Handroanthus impetiginosus]PIN15414.1 hypothetical protein CDL12_11926 [Handroanthus impetiginosus]